MKKILYYTISDDLISIYLEDDTQIFIESKSWRYDIAKKKLLSITTDFEYYDTEWFRIPAITEIPELEIDDSGNVNYMKGGTQIRNIQEVILKNLIDYYDTPIYDIYRKIVDNRNWAIEALDKKPPNIILRNSEDDFSGCTLGILKDEDYEWSRHIPYVMLKYVKDCDETDRDLSHVIKQHTNEIDCIMETFWKTKAVDKWISGVSDKVKEDARVLEKLVNTLDNYYEVNPEVIPFIHENSTDLYKMEALVLTGMLNQRSGISRFTLHN